MSFDLSWMMRRCSALLVLLYMLAACGSEGPAATDDDDDVLVDAGPMRDSELDGGRPARDAGRLDTSRDAATTDAGRRDVVDAGRGLDGSVVPLDTLADAGGDGGPPRMGFLPVKDLAQNGPYATQNGQGDLEGPSCVIHRPATLGAGGVRHPVILWGMGTGGFNTYQGTFELWASHGFVVAASLLGNGQGDGKSMLACLQYACDTYAAHVDCRAGATGHSQGGGGALMTGMDPRVITTAPIQAYTGQGFGGFDQASIAKQRGPMLLLSGTADTIAVPSVNQEPVFLETNVPVMWANLVGGDHVLTGIDGAASYRSVALAWFRLQLMGDEDFRGMFYGASCALCTDSKWMVQRRGIQ